jgi:hypothetical protein
MELCDIRQGEVVYPSKMAGLKPEMPNAGRENPKQSEQKDPATSGSLNKPSVIPAKYSEFPLIFSKFLVKKIHKSADLGIFEASYAKVS